MMRRTIHAGISVVALTTALAGAGGLTVASAQSTGVTATVPCLDGANALVADLLAAYNLPATETLSLASGCVYQITNPLADTPFDWYGPSGLPAIDGTITIEGNGATIEGGGPGSDYRLFYVAPDPTKGTTAGFTSPGAGNLTLNDLTLEGGYARGGDGIDGGGGGAGLGGAILNEGTLTLDDVSVIDNTAQGGSGDNATGVSQTIGAGGGIGTSAISDGAGGTQGGGGFGQGSFGGSTFGKSGSDGGGGGGGFITSETGGDGGAQAGDGGGPNTGFGGPGGTGSLGGDGSGGGGLGGENNNGGGFGEGGGAGGGGGGVGGGGGPAAGGGFGGGGGTTAAGGFGGGGGGSDLSFGGGAWGGFGGGSGGSSLVSLFGNLVPQGGGGAGMGGAIFNLLGTVTLTNSTFAGNQAVGGSAQASSNPYGAQVAQAGGAYGGAVFNLDGTVLATDVTITGDPNDTADNGSGIYSLGYYSNAGIGTAPGATTTLTNSIVESESAADAIVSNAPSSTTAGTNYSTSTVQPNGTDLINSYGGSLNGPGSVSSSDPMLTSLAAYGGSTLQTEPPNPGSPAIAAGNCPEPSDEVGRTRPTEICTLGAVEVEQPPSAPIATPVEGAVYTVGQAVDAEYQCEEGANGPGLMSGQAGCGGTVPNGAALDTSTPGPHSFTVTSTSQDGFSTSVTTDYTIEGGPSATIAVPIQSAYYARGQAVPVSYHCVDGTDGPGLEVGSSGCGAPVANGGALDTSTLGSHSFAVRATSTDGLASTRTATYTVALPPSESVTTPANGSTFTVGQQVLAQYTCSEGTDGPGLSPGLVGCNSVVAPGVAIDTSSTGTYFLRVTATSADGLSSTQTVSYTVTTPAPATPPSLPFSPPSAPLGVPASTAPPALTGPARAGSTLSCSPGSWTEDPTGYTYEWSRDGTPIVGATGSTYAVVTLDEGAAITCLVSASTSAGTSAGRTSGSLSIHMPAVRRCPAVSGSVHGTTIGNVHLGMSVKAAARAYRRSAVAHLTDAERFCLTPAGLEVGYAKGKVAWIATGAPHYALAGVRPGATLDEAQRALPGGSTLTVAWNTWYFAPDGSATAVIKTDGSEVEEIGLADRALTRTESRRSALVAKIG